MCWLHGYLKPTVQIIVGQTVPIIQLLACFC